MSDRTPVDPSAYTADYFSDRCGGIEFFKKHGFSVLKPAMQMAVARADLKPGMKILDVGCGRGELVAHLTEKGYDAIGVDYAPSAVEFAKKMFPHGRFVLSDAGRLPFEPGSFDRIFMLGTIEHLTDPEIDRALDGAFRLLKPGGRLMVNTCTNRLYHKTLTYRVRLGLARLLKRKEPLPPRSDEDEELHVNEQHRFSLQRRFRRIPAEIRVYPLPNPKDYAPEVYPKEILNDLPLRIRSGWRRRLGRLFFFWYPLNLFVARSNLVVATKRD